MPVVIPFIVYAVATYAVGYATATIAILTLISSLAVAEYQKKQAEEDARAAYLNSLQDRLIQVRSGVAPRGYVIGTVRLGGALLYINTLGAKSEALDQVVAFANNECTLVDWILGNDFIFPITFPGSKYGAFRYTPISEQFTVTGPSATVALEGAWKDTVHVTWRQPGASGTATFSPHPGGSTSIDITGLPAGSSDITCSYQISQGDKLRGQFKSGTLSQTPTDWDGYPNPEWDSSHRLAGVCYLRTLYLWDQNVYQQGAPQLTAVLAGGTCDGYPFYDPRDSSSPTSTTNPALVWAWWMTLPRFMGGMGVPVDWIDYTSVAAAANICDELVTVRNLNPVLGYEQIKRYECDTYLATDVAPLSNMFVILSAMAGTRVFTGGKYKVFAGAFRPAIVTLTDSDIDGNKPFALNSANISIDPPNIVTSTIADFTQQWQQSSPNPVRNDTYVTDDGAENPLDLKLQATTDPRRARYLMGIALEQGRPAFGVSCSIAGIGETLGLGDTVQLNLVNRPQYAGRTFEIVDMTDNWDGTFDVTLAEMKTATFALDPDAFTPITPVTPTDNSYLWNPPHPTGFDVISMSPTTLPDGTAVTRVVLGWDPIASADPGSHFDVRYRTTGGDFIDGGSVTGDATGTVLTTALIDGELYQFEARFVNGMGAQSDWVDAYTPVSGIPLPTPLSLRLSATSQIFRVPETGNALPVSITLTAVRTGGLSASAVWSTSPSVTLGGSGDVRTLAYADMGGNDAVQITVTVTQSAVVYQDVLTIVKVFDGASQAPDLTAPPTPTGLTVQSFLVDLFLTWDPPTYTQGGGNEATIVYGKQINVGDPQPAFTDATVVGSSATNAFAFPTTTGATWAFWIKFQTREGVRSVLPAGGTHGVQGTTGIINGVNLADGVVTAQKLADGTITATKLADGAITATKLANNLQAVTIVTGTLPSTNVGNVIFHTDDDKLYHWNGSTYTAGALASDIQGQLSDTQLAAIAAAKITGTISNTQIADGSISTPKLAAGSVTSEQIAADTITAGNIAVGAIGVSELAADSVTANAIAANAVTAGKIAAAAVNAQQIAAGAITTDKLLVTGRGAALNDDPSCSDASAWILNAGAQFNIATISDGAAGNTVIRSTSGAVSQIASRMWPFDPSKTYRVRALARSAGSNGAFYLAIMQFDANKAPISNGGYFYYAPGSGTTPPSSFTEVSGSLGPGQFEAGAKFMALGMLLNYGGTTGYQEAQDARIEEAIPASLIVDGGITATKLAANSIAVGTAAIQTGAIVNAMIANAAIDSAKIIELSVSKISAGTLGADIGVGAGRITFDNGSVLRAQGTGFGSSNQFVDWFGVRPTGGNLALCTEVNAEYYLKVDGSAYFGGALSAGTLTTKAATSDTSANAIAETAIFGSNGGTITVVFSFAFNSNGTGGADSSGSNSAAVQLYRSLNGASYVLVDTLNATGGWAIVSGFAGSACSGSHTFTDPTHSTQTRQYKAVISSRACVGFSFVQQTVSIICTE